MPLTRNGGSNPRCVGWNPALIAFTASSIAQFSPIRLVQAPGSIRSPCLPLANRGYLASKAHCVLSSGVNTGYNDEKLGQYPVLLRTGGFGADVGADDVFVDEVFTGKFASGADACEVEVCRRCRSGSDA